MTKVGSFIPVLLFLTGANLLPPVFAWDCIYGRDTPYRLPTLTCVGYTTHMGEFGAYIRQKREQLQKLHPGKFSVRKVAAAIDIESSYLSKIERGIEAPPGEGTIIAIATELDEDADVLLAMAGKVSGDLQKIIRHRPQLFAEVIRQMKDMPDHAIVRVVREVRDGNW